MQPELYEREFQEWLESLDVTIDGVGADYMHGKGRGLAATRHIKEGERLVHVPAAALLSVPRPNQASRSRPSVHAALALKLMLNRVSEDKKTSVKLWWSMMPELFILRQCMPLLWPETAQALLPGHAQAMLEEQRKKFHRDLTSFKSMSLSPSRFGFPPDSSEQVMQDAYAHSWLLVNTRSFYWDYPTAASQNSKQAKSKKVAYGSNQGNLPTDECMALVPFIDLFNHTYVGECCEVHFDHEGFKVFAGRDYDKGEEIHVTYGNYGNEFLLVEYGFMMDPNVCDTVLLDPYVIPEFNNQQREFLEQNNLFGNYNLHASTSPSNATPPTYCYRTQCALRALKLPLRDVQRFIDTGGEGGDADSVGDKTKIHDMWKHICGHIFENVMKTKQRIESELAEGAPQEILLARWNQISDMVFATLED